MDTTDKIASILKEYTKKHNIMASHVILKDYAEELVKNGLVFKDDKQIVKLHPTEKGGVEE